MPHDSFTISYSYYIAHSAYIHFTVQTIGSIKFMFRLGIRWSFFTSFSFVFVVVVIYRIENSAGAESHKVSVTALVCYTYRCIENKSIIIMSVVGVTGDDVK